MDAVYSAHCLQHIDPYNGILKELARVCRVDAGVEIRVPHWMHASANIGGQRHVLPEHQVRQWEEFADDWWGGCTRMLRLKRCEYVPSGHLGEAQRLFPNLKGEEVLRYIPNACHEVRFLFTVQERA